MKGSSWIYQCVFPLTYSPGNRVSLSLTGLRQSVRRTVLWKKYLPPSQFLSFFFILSHLNLTLMIWNKFVKWCLYFKWRFWGDSYFSHMVRDFCIAFVFEEIKSSFKNNILCILWFSLFLYKKIERRKYFAALKEKILHDFIRYFDWCKKEEEEKRISANSEIKFEVFSGLKN